MGVVYTLIKSKPTFQLLIFVLIIKNQDIMMPHDLKHHLIDEIYHLQAIQANLLVYNHQLSLLLYLTEYFQGLIFLDPFLKTQ